MKNLKRSIITSQVKNFTLNRQIKKTYLPKAGDVAVFKVEELGKHSAIQCIEGYNRKIFPGDYILATFGNRYATNQLEGYVPDKKHLRYHILGQGGVIGICHSLHKKYETKGPTTLKLVGYATDKKGTVINTVFLNTLPSVFNPIQQRNFKVLLSVGSSMDSGKTTTAGFLCRGLKNTNQKVAYIKLTGTVYSKDKRFVQDCGAHYVTDFADFGLPSTYMNNLDELLTLYASLLDKVEAEAPKTEYVVIEIADGLLQRETEMLLHNASFMNTVDGVILSCGDSMGIMSGIEMLEHIGHRPFALAGCFTSAPLLRNEVEKRTNIPVLTLEDLENKSIVSQIFRNKRALARA